VRGVSRQKGTEFVLDAWHQNPKFPPLDLVARDWVGPFPVKSFGNVRVHQRMNEGALRALQRTRGIHVYPSFAEGFGHALNEARAVGAVLITTDGPPMSDLVRDGDTGFLVPVRPERIRRFGTGPSMAFPVTPDDLAETVRRALQMNLDDRREMGRRAREAFLSDRAAFVARLRDAIADMSRDQARAESHEPRAALA
jgi:glycosyltransferase involved in cell wall biosynthesis